MQSDQPVGGSCQISADFAHRQTTHQYHAVPAIDSPTPVIKRRTECIERIVVPLDRIERTAGTHERLGLAYQRGDFFALKMVHPLVGGMLQLISPPGGGRMDHVEHNDFPCCQTLEDVIEFPGCETARWKCGWPGIAAMVHEDWLPNGRANEVIDLPKPFTECA